MLIEYLKNGLQITMHKQAPRRGHVHDRDLLLEGDGFENVGATRSARCDLRSFARGILRIQNVHRNVLLNGGQHGGWMEDLLAEISELGSLVKTVDLNPAS